MSLDPFAMWPSIFLVKDSRVLYLPVKIHHVTGVEDRKQLTLHSPAQAKSRVLIAGRIRGAVAHIPV